MLITVSYCSVDHTNKNQAVSCAKWYVPALLCACFACLIQVANISGLTEQTVCQCIYLCGAVATYEIHNKVTFLLFMVIFWGVVVVVSVDFCGCFYSGKLVGCFLIAVRMLGCCFFCLFFYIFFLWTFEKCCMVVMIANIQTFCLECVIGISLWCFYHFLLAIINLLDNLQVHVFIVCCFGTCVFVCAHYMYFLSAIVF